MRPHNLFKIDLKVYISGVRMPVISVSITTAQRSVPRATIALPPDSRLYGIGRRDKVPVQIFITDTFTGNGDDILGRPPTETYKEDILVFEGEIGSFAYHSTAIGKEFIINAHGVMVFLDDISIKTLNTKDEHAGTIVKGEDFASLQATGTLTSALPGQLFTHGLFGNKKDPGVSGSSIIKYPFEFLENTIKYITGEAPKAPETAVGNFYKEYTNDRLNLGARIAPIPCFDDGEDFGEKYSDAGFPILHALQTQAKYQMLDQMSQDAASSGTLNSFMNIVVDLMEYELAHMNSPSPVGTEGTQDFRVPFMYLKPILYEALPPKCNVVYRAHCSSLSTQETVYQVPTRIRTEDIYGSVASMSQGADAVLGRYQYCDYWPRDMPNTDSLPDNKEKINRTLLASETNTGPHLYTTQGPRWMSFTGQTVPKEEINAYSDTVRKHLLLLKIYESRQLNVTMPYNPFLTVGYPAVVYDSEDTGFTFIGHLMTVEHSLSETSATTSAVLTFVRLIDDELNEWDETDDLAATNSVLHNTLKDISDLVTKQYEPMCKIYQQLLGCDAVESFQDIKDGILANSAAHEDPSEAYRENYRRIVTLSEYASIISIHKDPMKDTLLDKEGSTYFGNRKQLIQGQELVDTLSDIATTIAENGTYSASFSVD